jgi:hypothetical protein
VHDQDVPDENVPPVPVVTKAITVEKECQTDHMQVETIVPVKKVEVDVDYEAKAHDMRIRADMLEQASKIKDNNMKRKYCEMLCSL